MDYYHRAALVENLHERVELLVAEVLPAAVARELHAVRAEHVERVDCLVNRSMHVRQGQRRAVEKTPRMRALHGGRGFVYPAHDGADLLLLVAVIGLRSWHRED